MHHSTRGTVLCILGSTSENALGPAAKRFFPGSAPRLRCRAPKAAKQLRENEDPELSKTDKVALEAMSQDISNCPTESYEGLPSINPWSKLLLAHPTWIRVSPLFPILQLKPFPVVHLCRLANTFQMEQPWIQYMFQTKNCRGRRKGFRKGCGN